MPLQAASHNSQEIMVISVTSRNKAPKLAKSFSIIYIYIYIYYTSKVRKNFDSSTGCEREMFGHLQHSNRVGDALIMYNQCQNISQET